MRNIKKRFLAVSISLSILLVVAAVACGGGDATPTPTATPDTPEPSPTSVVPTPFPVETFTSQVHGITLSIPQGWIIDDSDPDVLTITNPTGLASVEVRLSTFAEPLTEAQFTAFVDGQILILQGELDDFTELSREEVDASLGVLLQFSFTEDGKERRGAALITFNNVRAAVLLAVVDAEFFDFFASLFEDVTASLQVQPTPPGPPPTPGPSPTPSPTPIATVTPGIFTDPSLGFTLDIPSGWGMMDPGKEAAVRFINSGGVIVQVLNAAIPSGMTVGVYALALQEARYQLLSGYNLLSETDTTVGTLDARELQFTATTGQGQSAQKYLVLVLKRGTQAYILEAIGDPAILDQQEAEVRGLMDSFRP